MQRRLADLRRDLSDLFRAPRPTVVALLATALLGTAKVGTAQNHANLSEHFEQHVRPILARRCHGCHGANKSRSGLRLDHRDFILAGGTRGPAVNVGEPEASLLLHAIRYDDVDLSMPPKGKLEPEELAILEQWVRDGAPWPDEARPDASTAKPVFDLQARKAAHWCWQPLPETVPVPAIVPAPKARSEQSSEIDAFLDRALADAGLRRAAPADRRTWLRRVSFDLTGLPPTRDELAAYVADESPDADARVVDRLLASPRHAEHFARHFLDLFRYAETFGHEFDFAIPNAWQYRDYVVRAIRDDVSYDRFIVEHIAGDLIEPRVDKATGINDAIVATGHWWLGDQTHSPVDVRKHQADRVDNQLDVVSKAFLGVTLACARCHDHKFDAISTEDYYALFGVVESSRYAQVPVRAASEGDEALLQELEDVRARIVTKALDSFAARASEVPEYLRAAELAQARASAAKAKREAEAATQEKTSKVGAGNSAGSSAAKKPKPEEIAKLVEQDRAACIAGVAAEKQLDSQELKAFVAALADRPGKLPAPTLARSPARIAQRAGDDVFADFTAASPESFAAWRQTGTAFGVQPTGRGVLSVDARGPRLRLRFSASDGASTAARSARAVGGLYSRSFVLDKRFLHIRARGRDSRINLVPEGFPLLRNPIWGHFKLHVTDEAPRWYRIDAQKQRGLRVAFEFLDQPVHDPADPFRRTYDERGYLHVEAIVLSDDGAPPRFAAAADNRTADATDASVDAAEAVKRAVAQFRAADEARLSLDDAVIEWLDWLGRHGLLLGTLEVERAQYEASEAKVAIPSFAPALIDEGPVDHHVHVRGDARFLGARVEARFLEALATEQCAVTMREERSRGGSGRLALAAAIASRDNPLTARVLVNRVWHWLFGQGIVPTTDNFGVLGEAPSHPELLDWLARRFVDEDAWSLRRTIRRIVLSETYRMSSRPHDEVAARCGEVDADNRLLHTMPLRRLTGEAIRDAMLAVSGRLDLTAFGPGVATHLTPFMDGRGRPGKSGPLDGAGRRSIWLEVRRNFLDPFFLAFDRPSPFSTFGRRTQSNVPAQALALLNDPLVHDQARVFAERITREIGGDGEGVQRARVERMFEDALGRPAQDDEVADCLALVEDSSLEALAHVLFNMKEFAWIR